MFRATGRPFFLFFLLAVSDWISSSLFVSNIGQADSTKLRTCRSTTPLVHTNVDLLGSRTLVSHHDDTVGHLEPSQLFLFFSAWSIGLQMLLLHPALFLCIHIF